MSYFKFNSTLIFGIFGTTLIASILLIEIVNGRFWLNDFKVMYSAASAYISADPVYGVSFGLNSGFYKYSPFTLLFFIPYTFISFKAACIIHFLLIGFCALSSIIFIEKIIRLFFSPVRKKQVLPLLAVLLCVINPLARELHLGNINVLLVFVLTLSLYCTLSKKPMISGALLAFAILAKPYFLLCILPLVVHKRYLAVLSTIGSIIAFVLCSAFLMEPGKSALLYQEWISAMMKHNTYLSSQHTIFSIIHTYFGIFIPAKYALHVLGIIGLLSSLYFYIINPTTKAKRPSKSKSENQHLIIHFYLLIAIVPSILITDTEHFIFTLPCIVLLLFHLKKNRIWAMLSFIALLFMYGGNSSELLGKSLSDEFSKWGILGISNLIIIGTVFFWFKKEFLLRKNEGLKTDS